MESMRVRSDPSIGGGALVGGGSFILRSFKENTRDQIFLTEAEQVEYDCLITLKDTRWLNDPHSCAEEVSWPNDPINPPNSISHLSWRLRYDEEKD